MWWKETATLVLFIHSTTTRVDLAPTRINFNLLSP